MTVTETDAPSDVATDAPALRAPEPATGIAGVLGSGDHKTIGRLYILTSLAFLLIAGIAGALVGVEKVDVGGIDVIDPDAFGQIFSLHAVAGTFLFLVPLVLGLGIYLVPLQVGSNSVAFPRAAAAAYWSYLIAGGVALASFVADGGPFGSDSDAVELFIAAMVAVLVSHSLAAICVGTTGIALRAPGMGLHRAPLFTWANIVTAILFLLTLPALAGLLVLVYIDHRYGQTFLGGSNGVFTRIAWAWSQPSVYVFAIPALGVIGDVVPVAAQTRITLHKVAMGCIGAFGIFAFGAWAMPGFGSDAAAGDLAYYNEIPFYAFSALVLVPVLAFAGLLGDTLRRGSVTLTSPLLWSAAALLLILDGVATGLLISIEPLDLFGTSAHAAHVHSVLGASLLGLFGALAHWSPKLFGGPVPETPSKLLALGGLAGVALLALPDVVSGFLNQGARLAGATDDVDAIEALNVLSLAGGGLLIVVALAFIGLVMTTVSGSPDDDASADDPWGGHTLEWASSSPAAVVNFDELPEITSEAPLYDARHRQEEGA